MLFTKDQNQYVGNLVIIVLVTLAIFLVAMSFNAFKSSRYIGTGGDVPNTLTFSGETEVRNHTDMAKNSFSFEKESDVVADAQEFVSEKISSTLKSLDSLGIKEKDIRTSSYNTNPRYDWNDGEQKLKGYVVSQSVDVIIRDISKTNAVVALLGEMGVTNLSGPYFDVEDKESYERLARKEAINAARAKAEELADDLGVKLIRIVSFNEGGNDTSYPQPYMTARNEMVSMDAAGAPKASPEIPIGENVVTANVTITYEIQ